MHTKKNISILHPLIPVPHLGNGDDRDEEDGNEGTDEAERIGPLRILEGAVRGAFAIAMLHKRRNQNSHERNL